MSVQAARIPWGWISQDFLQSAQEGASLSALRTGRLYPKEILSTHCCYRLSGLNADRRAISLETFQWPHRKSNPRPPVVWCSVSTNCAIARLQTWSYSFQCFISSLVRVSQAQPNPANGGLSVRRAIRHCNTIAAALHICGKFSSAAASGHTV